MIDPKLRINLRAMTRGAYDLQKLRMAAGLRLCGNFRSQLGQAAGDVEDDLDDEAKEILKRLRDSFKRLTDGIARNRTLPAREGFVGDDLISGYTELVLVQQYFELERVERQQFGQLEAVLCDFPIWTAWLGNQRGVGPAMGAVIISEFDIAKARYPSSLWKYAGLDVGPDGRGRSRRKEHLVKRAYTDKGGKAAERDSVTYNPWLKTKLMGVLAGSFLRSGSDWAEVYRGYKHRLQSDPAREKAAKPSKDNPGLWTPGRINDAAKRYMIKIFLLELYKQWRTTEGLPVEPSYQEKMFGHVHGGERDVA